MKLFETFREFCVFVFKYRATNENTEFEENKIRVIFDRENLWKGMRVSLGIILRLLFFADSTNSANSVESIWPFKSYSQETSQQKSLCCVEIYRVAQNTDDDFKKKTLLSRKAVAYTCLIPSTLLFYFSWTNVSFMCHNLICFGKAMGRGLLSYQKFACKH